MNPMDNPNNVTFPSACYLMRRYFHPIGFEATLDAPDSMRVRLFDRASDETLVTVAGLRCATVMNTGDMARIINVLEDELECFVPPRAWQALA